MPGLRPLGRLWVDEEVARLSLGAASRVVHCAGCGLILGKDSPPDLCTCPRCGKILRVRMLDLTTGRDRFDFIPATDGKRRFVALWTSAAMVRFLLREQTARPQVWEELLVELEEERLKAFARVLGWTIVGAYRDPGAHVADSRRPFDRLTNDLEEGLVNTIAVTDTERVSRKDLQVLWRCAEDHDAAIVTVYPHAPDRNLEFDEVDYHAVPDASADNRALERVWNDDADAALGTLFAATGWHWTDYAADVLAGAIGREPLQRWRDADPQCKRHGWRHVLTGFAIARARRSGRLEALPLPRLGSCRLCSRRFLDAAVPARLVELTAGRHQHCANCLARAFFQDRPTARAAELREDDGGRDAFTTRFRELKEGTVHRFLERVLARRAELDRRGVDEPPSNPWLGALRDVGLLDELGEVALAEGYYRARDGHLLKTLGAALVDNWLVSSGVEHRRDVRYPRDEQLNPQMTMRADFAAGDVLIEYLGLRGADELGKGFAERKVIAERGGRVVVGFYAEDLLLPAVLQRKAGLLIPDGKDTEDAGA